MKICFAIVLLLCAVCLVVMVACERSHQSGESANRLIAWLAANATPVNTVDPNSTETGDLKKFGESVGNARIVLLGEQTHGEGNVFSLKVRLVKYLHEHLGFDVLVMESGMFDGAQIWHDALAGAATDADSQGSIFFMYSRATQVKPLFQYIDSQKSTATALVLASMDTPHAGLKSEQLLLNTLTSFLNQNHLGAITSNEDWPGFLEVATKVIALQNPPASLSSSAFHRMVFTLRSALKTVPDASFTFPNSSEFWLQIVKSIDAQFQDIVTAEKSRARDDQMADNLQWLASKEYAGKKLVVWSHNGHCLNVFPSMGGDLKSLYGDALYTAVFTGSAGSFLQLSFKPTSIHAPPACSWESAWHNTGQPISFLDVRGTKRSSEGSQFLGGRLSIRLNDFRDGDFSGKKVNGLGRVLDGIFYLDQIQPVAIR